ncbi:ESKIMO 1 protein [Nymphaea thermarum]|nr:ESKIMO 1 protein [Nymphaea thermarum]
MNWFNPNGSSARVGYHADPEEHLTLGGGNGPATLSGGENMTSSMKVLVFFVNLMTLSKYRKDTHTSVYRIRQGKLLNPEQKTNPETYADCIHWCLHGLPDTWNEFLNKVIWFVSFGLLK